MLERATACLKPGAARDSLRCTGKAARSRRMLHSSFWNHGAGALDLPAWMLSMLPMPSDVHLKDDSRVPRGIRSQKESQKATANEGVFLDFLYPPKALAWLQRKSPQQQMQRRCASQQLQRWEKRNISRLPHGFVVATRGYASKIACRKPEDSIEADAEFFDGLDNQESYTPFHKERSQEEEGAIESSSSFADSPGELAETSPNQLNELRNLMRFNRKGASIEEPATIRRLVNRAWTIYQSLDESTRNDSRLIREMLDWLALHHSDATEARCEELYRSIPTGQRSLEIYQAMLWMYSKRGNFEAASNLHHECLQTLENGYMVSRILFEYAMDHERWDIAAQTASQHHKRYTELGQGNQINLFWLHVAETPQLLSKAINLLETFRTTGLQHADFDTRLFCARFFKEAISQFLRLGASADPMKRRRTLKELQSQQRMVLRLLHHVTDMDDEPAKFLEETLSTFYPLFQSDLVYANYHAVISGIYSQYRKLPKVKPPQHLLAAYVHQLSSYEPARNRSESSPENITLQDIMDDWKHFYGKPSVDAYRPIVSGFAWSGKVDQFQHWMQDFRSVYPSYEAWKGSLWTEIYLYARRMDLDRAQQAFSDVKRMAAEHGDEPDLKCWAVLLHAHGRADDLEGAFTNFQNLVDSAKLTPNEACFAPILAMLSSRGDVDDFEDFMQQFDEIVQRKRQTSMIAMLMKAHINSNDLRRAENILEDVIPKVKAREIVGSLERCFNPIMQAYANRRQLKKVIETFQRMRKEGGKPNWESFISLIEALMGMRKFEDAIKVLRVDMPEHGVEPTAIHYASLMKGLMALRDYKRLITVHGEMTDRNIKPSVATNKLYIRAKTLLEAKHQPIDPGDESPPVPLSESMEALESMLEQWEGEEVSGPRFSTEDFDDSTGGDPATYFGTLIAVHGQRNCFDAVQKLFDRYKEVAKKRGADETRLPLIITNNLMSAHWHAGQYDQVEEYWKFAKQRIDEIAPPVPVPSFRYLVAESALESADPLTLRPLSDDYNASKSNDSTRKAKPSSRRQEPILLQDTHASMKIRPATGRRHLLNEPLRWYLATLNSQSRIADAISTVSRVLTQGYTIDRHTWNVFICSLLDSTPPLALLAFILTERFLAPGFTTWYSTKQAAFPSPAIDRYEGTQYIRARYLSKDRLLPEYKTLVRLGAAFLDIRRLDKRGKGAIDQVPKELQRFIGTTKEIRSAAGRTVQIVQSMPHIVGEQMQEKYLRRTID